MYKSKWEENVLWEDVVKNEYKYERVKNEYKNYRSLNVVLKKLMRHWTVDERERVHVLRFVLQNSHTPLLRSFYFLHKWEKQGNPYES